MVFGDRIIPPPPPRWGVQNMGAINTEELQNILRRVRLNEQNAGVTPTIQPRTVPPTTHE